MTTVIGVVNAAGGVAKSTTATNLGVGLAEILDPQGRRVLIIDLDPQGDSASTMLGLKINGRCVSKVIDGKSYVANGQPDLKAAYRANIMAADRSAAARPGLYVLPGSDRIKYVKEDLIAEVQQQLVDFARKNRTDLQNVPTVASLVVSRLDPLKKLFDAIILDCPPSSDTFEEAIFAFSDIVVTPTVLDYKSVRATMLLTRRVIEAQKRGHSTRIAYIVPTMVEGRLNLAQSMLDSLVEGGYGDLIVDPIPRTVSIPEGPASGGLTILEYADTPQGAASKTAVGAAAAYQSLVDRIYRDHLEKELAYA